MGKKPSNLPSKILKNPPSRSSHRHNKKKNGLGGMLLSLGRPVSEMDILKFKVGFSGLCFFWVVGRCCVEIGGCEWHMRRVIWLEPKVGEGD